MALLALPVARAAAPLLTASERELVNITASLVSAAEVAEPELLDSLTQLEAEIEHQEFGQLRYCFAAADAYYELMRRRIDELREQRIQGLKHFRVYRATACAGDKQLRGRSRCHYLWPGHAVAIHPGGPDNGGKSGLA